MRRVTVGQRRVQPWRAWAAAVGAGAGNAAQLAQTGPKRARQGIKARAQRVKQRAFRPQSARSRTFLLQPPALPRRAGAHVHSIRVYTAAACIQTLLEWLCFSFFREQTNATCQQPSRTYVPPYVLQSRPIAQ